MADLHTPADLETRRRQLTDRPRPELVISVSAGTCGRARGAQELVAAFQAAARAHAGRVTVKATGCHGYCDAEPNVILYPGETFYRGVTPSDAERITAAALAGQVVADRLCRDNGTAFTRLEEIPFYRKQRRILLRDNPLVDPASIDDYIAAGGYKALAAALGRPPETIIAEVKASGLRGRGGAGFPTGTKWAAARSQPGDEKFVICNADEGDPGAYMDRSLMEGNPHSVIEGMIIGAYAIGAHTGWVYVRDEYPLAVRHVTTAIADAAALSLLGPDILGSGFSFEIRIARGAGSFVCGEETALIRSIENQRGIPRPRPPFPARQGLFGKPTNINNVETWANIPHIINNGAAWFAGIGTATSAGTKIFSLVGQVRNTGLIEVPIGITLREIIYDIGGGSPRGRTIKAVQTGGPSGGCIPAKLFDLPVDYESLKQAGSIMGSGGMIVIDEDTCMVDFARYFMGFLQSESCGKCAPCREGTQQMHRILSGITAGTADAGAIDLLAELGDAVKATALCGLGQTAPNPVLSTIRYFGEEYRRHIVDKTCPAGVCKALIRYEVDATACTGCGLCVKNCPVHAASGARKKPHTIDPAVCTRCGVCAGVCPAQAIRKERACPHGQPDH